MFYKEIKCAFNFRNEAFLLGLKQDTTASYHWEPCLSGQTAKPLIVNQDQSSTLVLS